MVIVIPQVLSHPIRQVSACHASKDRAKAHRYRAERATPSAMWCGRAVRVAGRGRRRGKRERKGSEKHTACASSLVVCVSSMNFLTCAVVGGMLGNRDWACGGEATGPCGLCGTLRNSAEHLVDTRDGGRNNVKGDGGPGCCDFGVEQRGCCRVVARRCSQQRCQERFKEGQVCEAVEWGWETREKRVALGVELGPTGPTGPTTGPTGPTSPLTVVGRRGDAELLNRNQGEGRGRRRRPVSKEKNPRECRLVDAAIAVFYSGLRFGLDLEEFDRACRPRARRTSWQAGGCSC